MSRQAAGAQFFFIIFQNLKKKRTPALMGLTVLKKT